MCFSVRERCLIRVLFNGMKSNDKDRVRKNVWDQVSMAYDQAELKGPKSRRFFQRKKFQAGLITAFFIASIFPIHQPSFTSSAGEILPVFGPVEIIRDNESFVVTDATQLQVGDRIRLGSRSQARWVSPGKLVTDIAAQTELKIISSQQMNVDRGEINHLSLKPQMIKTERGTVQVPAGSRLNLQVRDTGETVVKSQNSSVELEDNFGNPARLSSGEKMVIRSEGITKQVTPEGDQLDVALSSEQIAAIRAKIEVARSKILSGIERSLVEDTSAFSDQITSAKNSLKQIHQVILSSRDLTPVRLLDDQNTSLSDIEGLLMAKNAPQFLYHEFRDLIGLMAFLDRHKTQLNFELTNTEIPAFNRFVILEKLKNVATRPDEKQVLLRMQEIYVRHFWRQTHDSGYLAEGQLTQIERSKLIPGTNYKSQFIRAVDALDDLNA